MVLKISMGEIGVWKNSCVYRLLPLNSVFVKINYHASRVFHGVLRGQVICLLLFERVWATANLMSSKKMRNTVITCLTDAVVTELPEV